MSNMSYCRFRNTLHDLNDCIDNLENTELSDEEAEARYQMIKKIAAVADRYSLLDDQVYIEGFNPNDPQYEFASQKGEDDA